MLLPSALLVSAFFACAHAHNSEGSTIADFDNDWATYHLAEEHHLSNFDSAAFYDLHVFEGESWSPADVRRMYGLEDESLKDVDPDRREEVTRTVFMLYDEDHNGFIDRDEFISKTSEGVRLPDFGLGPGHHGDDEYEYEIHHFEKYHDENSSLEDLIHPEDIEHFAKHDREDDELERIALQNQATVIEANIPDMFLRKSEL